MDKGLSMTIVMKIICEHTHTHTHMHAHTHTHMHVHTHIHTHTHTHTHTHAHTHRCVHMQSEIIKQLFPVFLKLVLRH